MMSNTWKTLKVRDLISALESGVSVNSSDQKPTDSAPCVLKVSAVTYGKFNPNAAKLIKKSEIPRAKCTPKKGQIIISRSNTPDLVGASAFVNKVYPYRYLPDKLWQTVLNKKYEYNTKWLFYYLSSPRIRYQLSQLATGTSDTMKNITKEELLSLTVRLPPLKVQQIIVKVFNTLESTIEKTEALIAAKEKQFEWLTTMLIQRTHGNKSPISNFVNEVSKRNRDNKISRVLSITNHSGFILPEEYFERRVASLNLSNYKIIKKGEYAYNPSRINVGSIARLDNWENGVLSPMYIVFKLNESIVCDYFLHWLNSSETRQRIKDSAQGSVRESVNFNNLKTLQIILPSLENQKLIAQILNIANKEIALLKQLTKKYQIQKRGLMQKLFTGELF